MFIRRDVSTAPLLTGSSVLASTTLRTIYYSVKAVVANNFLL
jgi:hypothetical protein